MSEVKRFLGELVAVEKGLWLELPFDPDVEWGSKPRHHVGGSVQGEKIRGVLARNGEAWGLLISPMWVRDAGLAAGPAEVALMAEGPQLEGLADDIREALEADPAALTFWLGLATFYRKGYLRWIDATKKRPDERVRRIAQTVANLRDGIKDYRDRDVPSA